MKIVDVRSTVEAPNIKGHVGTSTNVHYSENVFYWKVSTFIVILSRVLYITTVTVIANQLWISTSKVVFVS